MSEVALHPYQADAVAGVEREFSGGRPAALVVLPTGTGKTYVGAATAAPIVARGGRVLVLAYRGELLNQWARTFDRFGLKWGVEKADQDARKDSLFGRTEVVLGSINTLRGKRLERWPSDHFDMIVYDEAHHGTAPSSLAILSHFHRARRLGLTATPNRSDGDDIQAIFGNCVAEYPLAAAVADGWLTPPTFRMPPCKVDLSKIDGSGDLNEGDLEDEIGRHIEELVNSSKPHLGGAQTLCFTPKVGSAQAMADGFRQVGVPARSVHGKSEDRDTVVDQFLALGFQLLSSCAMLLEGFDAPATAALVIARPTRSPVLYRQMIGRGLRTYPGKTHCVVVDWAWNCNRHDLMRPVDLYDTTGTDLDVLKIADGLVREGKESDPLAALDRATDIHRVELARRVTVREREPKYRMIAYDPFCIGQLLGIPNRHQGPGKAPSKANRAGLEKLKLDPGAMSDREAEALLKEIEARRVRGLATHRQVALLVSRGVPPEQARALSFEAARQDLDLILGTRV